LILEKIGVAKPGLLGNRLYNEMSAYAWSVLEGDFGAVWKEKALREEKRSTKG